MVNRTRSTGGVELKAKFFYSNVLQNKDTSAVAVLYTCKFEHEEFDKYSE